MSRLMLGTVQFGLPYGIANTGGQVTRSVAKDMLEFASVKGIDTLDTAIAYGESETCLGEVGGQRFKMVTKLPAVPCGHDNLSSWVREQLTESFTRLGVHSVYGLLLHRPDQLLTVDGKVLFQALRDLKEDGLVQKIGVSIYAASELDVLIPQYNFDLVQAPFNLIDRRLQTSGWLQRLKEEGVEVHTRSAFLQGLLLMPRVAIPSKFAPWGILWDKWHEWLGCHSLTAVEASLGYLLSFPEIDRVIVGADTVNQLQQIISAEVSASPDDFPDLQCADDSLINPARWCTL